MMRPALFVALFGAASLVSACNPASTPEAEEPAPEENAAPETPEIEPAPAASTKGPQGLVPSVLETQAALKKSGIDTELATLAEKKTYDLSADATDRVAVRTGVVLADMLLTVKESDKERLLDQLATVRKGMNQLEGGSDIDRTIGEFQEAVAADSVTREELLAEFDQLSGAVIPELEFNGNQRIVPLISAGSWLEGTHLVARALTGAPADERAEADKILKAPAVVDYFNKYVTMQGGSDTAPEPVAAQLRTTLSILKDLASKPEPLTDQELEQVSKTTGDVLSLL